MIRVTIKGKDENKRFFDQLPAKLGLALYKAMQDSAILIQSLAKVNAPVFRSSLRVSIVQSVTQNGNRLVGEVGSALPYATVIEFGRSAGWFPPIEELKLWARRKLGNERLAFVIGRAIQKRGFRAQAYLSPAIESAQPRIQMIFDQRIKEAIQAEGGDATGGTLGGNPLRGA